MTSFSFAKIGAYTLLLIAFLSQTALSQSKADTDERKAVLDIVHAMFDLTETKDVKGLAAIYAPEGRWYYSREGADGKKIEGSFSNREDMERLPNQKEIWTERFWDPTVLIHGDVATVWAPYDFWIDGRFSHCGVDTVTLLKFDGKWKITGGAYTVEKECEPSPLGPLKKK